MLRVLDSLRPALALWPSWCAVDFTSYLLSVIGDAFFVGALLLLVWPAIKSANQSADHQ
ncbi:MAG: DUF3927 family protein [Escherichia coli]